MKLSDEDLIVLRNTQMAARILELQAQTAAVESGRAAAEARAAQLEYENSLLRIYLKYGLSDRFMINEATGEIQEKEDHDDREENTNTNSNTESESNQGAE